MTKKEIEKKGERKRKRKRERERERKREERENCFKKAPSKLSVLKSISYLIILLPVFEKYISPIAKNAKINFNFIFDVKFK